MHSLTSWLLTPQRPVLYVYKVLVLCRVPSVPSLDCFVRAVGALCVLLVVSFQVILAANGRPVVVMNPRVPYMPFEMEAFEIVYQLRQYNVQPAKANPKAAKVRES